MAPKSRKQPEPVAEKGKGRGVYLPVLPDEWRFTLSASGPGGEVHVHHSDPTDEGPGGYVVTVTPEGGVDRAVAVDTLVDGMRLAVKAVKALIRLHRHDLEVESVRREMLSDLGVADADDHGLIEVDDSTTM